MALLDTSDLITELNTIISGLTLSTEEEQRLATLLRSAVNVQEDPTGIISELQDRIEAIDNTVLLEKFALLAISLNIATTDRSIKVATVDDLPDLYTTDTTPNGSIIFVSSIGVDVVSVGNKWLGLDGRLLRDDTPPVYAMGWGTGTNGQVGDGTVINRSSPVSVVGGITNWSAISGGNVHSLGIAGGIAYAWGRGINGRLGDGTTIFRSSPVTVVGGITNWSQVSGGTEHSLGIAGGVAYAWGDSGSGELGDGTTIDRSSPVTVVGGITNWSSIFAGGSHSLGLTDTGVIYTWGSNSSGQLGDGTTVSKSSPITIAGGITNWSAINTSSFFCLAITDTGVLYSWGSNNGGQLGDGTRAINKSSPVTVVGGITNWSQVAAAGSHSLGLTDTGVLYAWGSGSSGRLGTNSTTNRSSPVTVVGGITNWSQITASGNTNLGLTADGVLYGWGFNSSYNSGGQVGDGTNAHRSSPVTVVGGITSWTAIEMGSAFSLALKGA